MVFDDQPSDSRGTRVPYGDVLLICCRTCLIAEVDSKRGTKASLFGLRDARMVSDFEGGVCAEGTQNSLLGHRAL